MRSQSAADEVFTDFLGASHILEGFKGFSQFQHLLGNDELSEADVFGRGLHFDAPVLLYERHGDLLARELIDGHARIDAMDVECFVTECFE